MINCHKMKSAAFCRYFPVSAVAVWAFFTAGAADYDVAAYVWPAFHNEPRWAELGIFADGKGEWQNLYEASARNTKGEKELTPLWGYEDESESEVVERKIKAALDSGVNVFVYDWYWYRGRPFLEAALNKGFLGAGNCNEMRFFIMYANHDVDGFWNNRVSTGDGKEKIIWSSKITDDDWRRITDRWITRYFSRPNYYKIGGKPVVSIYSLRNFVEWEGLEKAASRLDYLKRRVKASGFPGLHLQVIGGNKANSMRKEIVALKVDSITSYNWTDHTWKRMNDPSLPELDYGEWGELSLSYHEKWHKELGELGITYFPNLSVGWDPNARYPAGETRRTVRNSSPEKFERFARRIQAWSKAKSAAGMPKLITVNSWNEWTECAHLEPDSRFGYGYLDALKRVFGNGGPKTE